jgi:thioredoxin-dependent peroxiredoxin
VEKKGAEVVGVSTDSVEKLARFKSEFNLPFILLSDEKGTVVEQYPGKIPVLGVANRATYVIGQDGVVKEVITGGDAIDPSTAVAACPIGKK